MKLNLTPVRSVAQKRLLFIMKTFLLFLCTTVFSFTTEKTYSQEKIKIEADKIVTVDEVFTIIQKQTKFRFLYPDYLFVNAKKVQLRKGVIKVSKLLEQCFSDSKSKIKFEFFEGNTIVVEQIENNLKPKVIEVQQTIKISGVVLDQNNQPLIGANILEKGTKNAIQSDLAGKFSIEVFNQKAVLVISFIGFANQEIAVNGQRDVLVRLIENTSTLGEVVVVGYGTTKKENLTGAVDQITSRQIQNNIGVNTSQLIQGIAPNLNVTFGSGDINEGSTINIRGIGSINGGAPLILVDGIEADINRINPRDIESISILKDASSAAIYGARAAFGVMLITTKSGKEGKIKINYNSNFGWSSPTIRTDNFITDGLDWARLTDKLSLIENSSTYLGYTAEDYAYLEARRNDPTLPSVLVKTINGVERYVHYGNTDWWNTLFSNSQASSEHNIDLSGGTDKVKVYLSGRFFSREGIYKINKDVLDQYNIKSKIIAKPNKWLEIGNSTNIFNKVYNHPATNTRFLNGADNSEDWRKYTFHASPLYLPRNPDGSLIIQGAYTGTRDIADGTFADLINGKSRGQEKDFEATNTVSTTINVTKNIKLQGDYTFRKRQQNEWVRIIPTPFTNQPNGEGISLYKQSTETYKELERNTLYQAINAYATFDVKTMKNHTLTALLGYNQEWNNFKRNIASRNGNLSENLNSFNLATGTNIFLSSVENEYAIRAGFYRIKYNILDRYLFEINGRHDLTSKFQNGKRYGVFPSASAAWKLSNESFWKNIKPYISSLKLRSSYGSLGNQNVSEYGYLSTMDIKQGTYISNGGLTNYFTTPGAVSSNYSWETAKTLDFGVDMGAFKNRLNIAYDWYQRDVIDMLLQGQKLPSVFGTSEPKENAADLRTKGFELSLKWKDKFNIDAKPFNYNIGLTLGDSRTFITKFDNPLRTIPQDEDESLSGKQFYVGQELGEIWGYTVEGFFQTDTEYLDHADQILVNDRIRNFYLINHPLAGDIKFADLDGDGKITPGAQTVDDPGDLKKIGNTNPRYNYGITIGAEFAGFDLNIFAQGIVKRDWNPGTDNGFFWGPFSRQYQNFYPKTIESNSWTPENPNAYFPRLSIYSDRGGPYLGSQLGVNSDKYIQNAAYLRIKNITLGYTIPKSIVSNLHVDSIRLYVTGVNLFTFSPLYKNNPDRTINPEQLGNGNDYPFTKTYAFGLNVNF